MFPSSSPATASAPRFTTAAASLVQTLEHGGNEGKRKQRARGSMVIYHGILASQSMTFLMVIYGSLWS